MSSNRRRPHPVGNGHCRPAAGPTPRPDGPDGLTGLLKSAARLAGPGPLRRWLLRLGRRGSRARSRPDEVSS
jgi:hypothetical protein